jgi:hypothetical protein
MKRIPKLSLPEWIRFVEYLIHKHSTEVITKGKYKGHRMTRTTDWIKELGSAVMMYLDYHNRGKTYDGNMAAAALMGQILVAWFTNVQRAKTMDPNRPLALRRQAYLRLEKYREKLLTSVTSDRVMGKVWGKQQAWNFPYGRGATSGKFV